MTKRKKKKEKRRKEEKKKRRKEEKKKRRKEEKKKRRKEEKKKRRKEEKKKKKEKKYDNGNDNWLAMNKNPNEWAVGFHGLRSPLQSANPITQRGLITDGAGQAYAAATDSRTGRPCGRGAYLSPNINVCENGYTVPVNINNKQYKVAFQCRIHPNFIRIPVDKSDYFILNESKHIRPYGILLKKIN